MHRPIHRISQPELTASPALAILQRSAMNSEKSEATNRIEVARHRRRRQYSGLFGGIGLGMMVSALIPWVRNNVDLTTVILWSGAAGVVITSWEQFEAAGGALTRKPGRALNLAVGFGLPLLLIVLLSYFIQR